MRKIIDLNYIPKPKKNDEEDLPVGALILLLSPFALFFWFILTESFLHGIF